MRHILPLRVRQLPSLIACLPLSDQATSTTTSKTQKSGYEFAEWLASQGCRCEVKSGPYSHENRLYTYIARFIMFCFSAFVPQCPLQPRGVLRGLEGLWCCWSLQSSVKRFIGSSELLKHEEPVVGRGGDHATLAGSEETRDEEVVGQRKIRSNGVALWSKADKAELVRLRKSGKSYEQIQKEDFPERSLKALDNMNRRMGNKSERSRWTDSEYEVLAAMREAGMTFERIQREKLPYRTVRAIRDRFFRLKTSEAVVATARRAWSQSDDDRLVALRRQYKPIETLVELFPGRTRYNIVERLSTLKQLEVLDPAHVFTAEDVQVLKSEHKNGASVALLSRILLRPPKIVRQKLRRLSLTPNKHSTPQTSRRWSTAEDNIIRSQNLTYGFALSKLLPLLPGRGYDAIDKRIRLIRKMEGIQSEKTKLKPWSSADVQTLLDLNEQRMAKGGSSPLVKDIARQLGRSFPSVSSKSGRLLKSTLVAH